MTDERSVAAFHEIHDGQVVVATILPISIFACHEKIRDSKTRPCTVQRTSGFTREEKMKKNAHSHGGISPDGILDVTEDLLGGRELVVHHRMSRITSPSWTYQSTADAPV